MLYLFSPAWIAEEGPPKRNFGTPSPIGKLAPYPENFTISYAEMVLAFLFIQLFVRDHRLDNDVLL